MNLAALIQNLPIRVVHGDAGVDVTDVVDDSRHVTPGALYIARRGTASHGRAFVDDAIDRGARAILVDPDDPPSDADITLLMTDDPAAVTASLAHRFHGHPARTLTVIGITGTNGKTTTAHLVHDLLNRCGIRCGLIGTVEVDDGHLRRPASLTTPGAVEMAKLLGAMVRNHCGTCVMEVSSHALDQGRVEGIEFDVAVFTNLSGDHLDYHGTMEHYAAAKARLFEQLAPDGIAIVNVDDAHCGRMILASPSTVWTVSMQREMADCRATVHSASSNGTTAALVGPWGMWHVRLPLVGQHNVFNALQASAAAYAARTGIADSLATALTRCAAPPGRLEPVGPPSLTFQVLVDYAHTDDALENVLAAVRPVVPKDGRLRVVFGCGGDRDRTKRTRMAAVASRLADEIVVTSDNPRTEDPDAIIDEVMGGITHDALIRTSRHADRRTAINATIETARPGDVIVIAGKGHEDYQIVGTTRRSFDDRLVASTAIRSLLTPSAAS